MEKILEFDSKSLKDLEKINHIAKHLFHKYIIEENRVVTIEQPLCVVDYGRHYMTLEDETYVNNYQYESHNILFSSSGIYECFKTMKRKEIRYLLRQERSIFIGNDVDVVYCGELVNRGMCYKDTDFNNSLRNMKDFEVSMDLTEYHMDNVIDGCILLLNIRGFKVRLAKPSMLNLKKKDQVTVSCRGCDDVTFETLINIKKENGISTQHIYTMLHY